jgi:phosphopantothenoylcysteine decarboxylase/phosphopantothenate--cysteine ligase
MGVSIANAAIQRGAKVILIAGSVSVSLPQDAETIRVNTTKEMFDAVMSNYERADVIIKAAAPADYAAQYADNKIKSETLTLNLVKNPDIAKAVGEKKGDRVLVVFSAETENLIANATKKLKSKHADIVVANDVTKEGAGFDVDTNVATVITAKGSKDYPLMSKKALADVILDEVAALK